MTILKQVNFKGDILKVCWSHSAHISSNISECTMLQTLTPNFSLATFLMTTLPWLLGAFIIFTRRNEFWDIYGKFTNTKELNGTEYILKKLIFLIGLTFFPMTVYLLLGIDQIF